LFNFGVDYYPEQWPETRWATDAQHMAEAGFNIVRLAEFAWAKLEPQEGRYDFAWLDRAISTLSARGLRVVLGTPTASPPAWLMQTHPDLFRVTEHNTPLTYGNRREYCPTNPVYRGYAQKIVTRLTAHYADHPAVIGWQIDNEFGDRCYCAACAAAFQGWLAHKYGTLDELNARWGTVFWSHTYSDWSQIPLPLRTGNAPNPSLALDFYRFASRQYVDFQQQQIEIVRATCPRHFITHNLMGFFYDQLDYFDLTRNIDFVSWDNYPRNQWNMHEASLPATKPALSADTMRGLKKKNFWVMEQQAGPSGWEYVGSVPRPGDIRLWAYQAIAHGADGLVFFRWRTARYGTEQYWHGLLDHDGTLSRRYREAKQIGAELRQIGDYLYGSEVRSPVAMVLSYDARFAFQIQPNNPQLRYAEYFHQLYQAFAATGVSIDIVAPLDDLSAYRCVVAPLLHIVTPAMAENLRTYAEQGGTLVLGLRAGVKDEVNAVVDARLPGLLSELCGVVVDEYDSFIAPDAQANAIQFDADPAPAFPVQIWCDVLTPTTAQPLAHYGHGHYAGRPAITVNQVGDGRVLYVGAIGDAAFNDHLAAWLLRARSVSINYPFDHEDGLEVMQRWQGERPITFVLNHTDAPKQLTLHMPLLDLLSNATLTGQVSIAPKEVLILVNG
jgi:beta-galactosidase